MQVIEVGPKARLVINLPNDIKEAAVFSPLYILSLTLI